MVQLLHEAYYLPLSISQTNQVENMGDGCSVHISERVACSCRNTASIRGRLQGLAMDSGTYISAANRCIELLIFKHYILNLDTFLVSHI